MYIFLRLNFIGVYVNRRCGLHVKLFSRTVTPKFRFKLGICFPGENCKN